MWSTGWECISFSSLGMNYYTYEQLVRGSMQYSVVAILDTVRFALDLLCFNIILLKCASERFREPYTAWYFSSFLVLSRQAYILCASSGCPQSFIGARFHHVRMRSSYERINYVRASHRDDEVYIWSLSRRAHSRKRLIRLCSEDWVHISYNTWSIRHRIKTWFERIR